MKHKSEGPDSSQLERLERKLDEALYELDFLRRHMSGYLGGGKAITYLADMTPFYVNSNDYGPPANYINGGLYEQENLDVLFSFLRDDTVFLDIGANLGFFAILLARRMPNGAVHAFEPHPQLVELMCASAFLNGLSSMDGHGRINVHRIGIGKTDGNARFTYPEGHLGGGGIGSGRASDIDVQLRSIDSFFGDEFRCDLIKIDVEGHELQALEGMSGVLARSPDVKVLFEKLGTDCGYETEIESLLHGLGMHLFGVTGNGTLSLLQPGALGPFSGYVLAARDLSLDRSTRNAVTIYPRQLFSVAETRVAIDRTRLVARGAYKALLAHGPYWFLRRGAYRLRVIGKIDGQVRLTITSRHGYAHDQFLLNEVHVPVRFVCHRDLVYFECVFRAESAMASLTIERIELERIG